MDLSVPAHVRVVNHGVTNIRERDGTLHPDLADVIVDEYETALSGGLVVSGYQIIPNLLSEFRSALVAADSSRIPAYDNWSEYLLDLATFTYQRPRVVQFYQAPQVNGQFGRYLNDSGQTVDPQPFVPVPIPPGFIDGRFTQMFPLTTAQIPDGSILPESVMRELCDTLVPKATEYCAGLILHFLHEANQTTSVEYNGGNPVHYALAQNYPNPFNPSTTIRFTIPRPGLVTLRVYNVLGREVATLVNGDLSSGSYQVTFEASGLASGVYFYRLVTPGYVETKKMLLLK